MNSILLALLACLIGRTKGQYYWDATKMVSYFASNEFEQICYERGNDLMCALRSSDYAAGLQLQDTRIPASAESAFILQANIGRWSRLLSRWGWFEVEPRKFMTDLKVLGWAEALQEIGDGDLSSDWNFARYVHQDLASTLPIKHQTYAGPQGGRSGYQETGARIEVAVNQKDGIILFQSALSPKVAAALNWERSARNPIRDEEMPTFSFQSDFVWREWLKGRNMRNQGVLNIKYMGCMLVNDYVTLKLMARYTVLNNLGELKPWPGLIFLAESTELRALLATYCGRNIFHFLVQHKKFIGIQHVVSVRVFKGPTFKVQVPGTDTWEMRVAPQMLFEIEPVPYMMQKTDPIGPSLPPVAGPGIPLPDDEAPPRDNAKLDALPNPFRKLNVPTQPEQPDSVEPDPVTPGPSTPRPTAPRSLRRLAHRDTGSEIAREVRHEMEGNDFLRVHTFHLV